MAGTPNTLGLILLLIVVFLACILWATHGHTATTEPEDENAHSPGHIS
jgi:hypothetical protein